MIHLGFQEASSRMWKATDAPLTLTMSTTCSREKRRLRGNVLITHLRMGQFVNKCPIDPEDAVSIFNASQFSWTSHFQTADQVTLLAMLHPQIEAKRLTRLL
ncbi:hypothetical protein INR49_021930, partial [Caranx melampygus]